MIRAPGLGPALAIHTRCIPDRSTSIAMPSPFHLSLLPALLLFADAACAQFRSTRTPFGDSTIAQCHCPVLLLQAGAPLADGWQLEDVRVANDRIMGTVRQVHPLAVYQLEGRHPGEQRAPVVHMQPKRFLVLHVSATALVSLSPNAAVDLPFSAVENAVYINQGRDGRLH